MSVSHIITCDECGEQYRFEDRDEVDNEGWLEIWSAGNEMPMDFCTRECVVTYHDGRSKEEE